jgi:hypothetical protein
MPDHQVLPRAKHAQPSVQLPAGIEQKAGLIGGFGEKASAATNLAATNL